MKKGLAFLPMPFLMVCALSMHAAQSWYSFGLSDRAVHCILADDTSAIIAGTDSGVSVRVNAHWYHIAMLPVSAIVRVSSTAVAVAAGNGSKSDGVYIGQRYTGPSFFSFKLGGYLTSPTALAAGPAVSKLGASAAGLPYILYAGNKNSVSWGLVRNDTLSELTVIPMPHYAFGVEDPFCASLHIYNNRLHAGGYDRFLEMAGQSYLLNYDFQDSLHKIRQMKTTAITEGRFPWLFGSNFQLLVIADLDSGVFFFDPDISNPRHRIDGPTGGSPIVSLYAGKTDGDGSETVLYAATKDGVFQGLSDGAWAGTCRWQKIGSLPAAPLYITGVGSKPDLLAATSTGVYRYGEQGSGIASPSHAIAGQNVVDKKTICVLIKNLPGTRKGRYNLQGRSIVYKASSRTKAAGVVITDIR